MGHFIGLVCLVLMTIVSVESALYFQNDCKDHKGKDHNAGDIYYDGCSKCSCDENGASCATLCLPRMWECPKGWKKIFVDKHVDKNAPEDCTCKIPECVPACPLALCKMGCPNGFEKDENGCQICKCKKADKCAGRPMCLIHCPHGREIDENGCDLCKCKKSCPLALCKMGCPNGFEKDENGCQICKCKKADKCAGRPMCLIHCPHGREVDENGCDLCKCKKSCPPLCKMGCPNGFKKDANGCEICECRSADKKCVDHPKVKQCSWKKLMVKRCSTSKYFQTHCCATCKKINDKCAGRPLCKIKCPFGNEVDVDGCPICKCKNGKKCVDHPKVKQCRWKKLAARRCPKSKYFQTHCCATCKKING